MTTLHIVGALIGLVLTVIVVKQRLWLMIVLNLILGYYWFYSPTLVSSIFIGLSVLFAIGFIVSLIGGSNEPLNAHAPVVKAKPGKKVKPQGDSFKTIIEEGLKEQRRIAEQQRIQEQFRADFAKHRKS